MRLVQRLNIHRRSGLALPALAAVLSACAAPAPPPAATAPPVAAPTALPTTAPTPAAAPAAAASSPVPTPATAASKPATQATKAVAVYGSVNGDDLPLWVAKEAGLFEKNGLDLDIQLSSNTSGAMAALLSGSAQFYQGGGSDAVSAAANGGDVVVVSMTSPVYSYVLEAAPDIRSPEDLRGKKIGISSVGSSSDIGVRVALRKSGLDPDKDVTIVAVGGVPERTAAMASGAIQATVVNPPETLALESQGYKPVLDLAALKLPASLQSTVVLRSFATSNHAAVQSYVDSLVQAIARVRQDRAFTIGVLKKYFKSDDDKAMQATYDFFSNEVLAPQPFPKPELFTDSVAELAKKNEKVKSVDLGHLLDPSFVQNAVDRKLAAS